jgi:hypothetical protein
MNFRGVVLTSLALVILIAVSAIGADFADNVTIARLKYPGGGDWYWGSSALPNLTTFIRQNTNIPIAKEEVRIDLSDPQLFNYPFLYMTGHGNVNFRAEDIEVIRKYLSAGGFLLANDSYGLKKAFLREMKKLFPDQDPREIPFNHGIFDCYYRFPNGLPKIHKHDGKPPQLFGWFIGDRLAVVLTFESDIGDGWEDPQVHNDPPEKRTEALQMGTNVLIWALMH